MPQKKKPLHSVFSMSRTQYYPLCLQESSTYPVARILPPGVKYAEHSIGRVVVDPTARNRGFGRAVMLEAIRRILLAAGPVPIMIQAQEHLADTLYRPLGFERVTDVYDEDGIPHVDMRLAPKR